MDCKAQKIFVDGLVGYFVFCELSQIFYSLTYATLHKEKRWERSGLSPPFIQVLLPYLFQVSL